MNPNVLTLREYESATIGRAWNPQERTVPLSVAYALDRLQRAQRRSMFAIGLRTMVAQQWVGAIGVGRRVIEVLPKTDEADGGAARTNLIRMLHIAGLVPHVEGGAGAAGASEPTIVDAFMGLYVRRLTVEWRRGNIRHYQRLDANRPCLKGKLLLAEDLRRNATRRDRFYTRADVHVCDVTLSQVLRAALQICRRFAAAERTRRSALELLGEFEDVSPREFTAQQLANIQVDRLNARFGPLLALAKLLLSGRVPERAGVGADVYCLLFDMNVVFEGFVGQLVRRACASLGLHAHLQISGRHLLLRQGRGRFGLRPDIGVSAGGQWLCLVDTKWKRLDASKPCEGVSQADMYQMYAYGKEYDCPRVVVLYPAMGQWPAVVASYKHPPAGETERAIDVCTIDIRLDEPVGQRTCLAQLRSLLSPSVPREREGAAKKGSGAYTG